MTVLTAFSLTMFMYNNFPCNIAFPEETGIITLSVGIALVVVIFAVLIVVDFCFCRKRRVHHKKKRCRNDGNRPKAFLSRPESCLKLAIHMSSGNAFRMHAQIAAMLVAKGGSGKDENRTPRTKKKKHHGNENGVATLPRLAEERKRGDTFQDGHLQDSQRINDWGKLSRIYFHKEDTRSLDKRRHAGKVAPLELDSSLRRSNLAVAFYLEDKGVAEEEITNSAIFETPYSDRILTDHPEDRTASPPELQNPWADLSEGLHSYPV